MWPTLKRGRTTQSLLCKIRSLFVNGRNSFSSHLEPPIRTNGIGQKDRGTVKKPNPLHMSFVALKKQRKKYQKTQTQFFNMAMLLRAISVDLNLKLC